MSLSKTNQSRVSGDHIRHNNLSLIIDAQPIIKPAQPKSSLQNIDYASDNDSLNFGGLDDDDDAAN